VIERGVLHGFRNDSGRSARMLLVATPARHDEFFRAMAALPVPHDRAAVQAVCERFGQVLPGLDPPDALRSGGRT